MKLRKYEVISPNYFSFPPEESNNSTVWNSKVPALELKSSKGGTTFGTRIYNEISTLRSFVRADSLHFYDSLFGYALILARY